MNASEFGLIELRNWEAPPVNPNSQVFLSPDPDRRLYWATEFWTTKSMMTAIKTADRKGNGFKAIVLMILNRI